MPVSRRSLLVLLALMLAGLLLPRWLQQRQAAAHGAALAQAAQPGDIEMLSSTTCVYCTRARELFTAHRVPFAECFIETDAACAARWRSLGGAGTPLLLVRGQPQLGFDARRVLDTLTRSAPSSAAARS